MSEDSKRALLPAGLRDLLPPDAAFEAAVSDRLLASFARYGYERVKPPLIEFEEGMLNGGVGGLADQTFRLMDPMSHRMMAVRSDLTPQVARIAASRLARSPRPLRLSYAGEILRVHGSELRPERQFGQVGFELVGVDGPESDAEVILAAVEALAALGVAHISVDLNAPTLVSSVLTSVGLPDDALATVRTALDRKDAADVETCGGEATAVLTQLLAATGPAESALAALDAVPLAGPAAEAARTLVAVARLVQAADPALTVTVDPVEWRGFEYHTGTSFSLFARDARSELGRGGRYLVPGTDGAAGEQATGCSLYMDALMRVLPRPAATPRLFVPHGTSRRRARALRDEGWITIAGLAPADDTAAEARRLGCSHHLVADAPAPVED